MQTPYYQITTYLDANWKEKLATFLQKAGEKAAAPGLTIDDWKASIDNHQSNHEYFLIRNS